MTMYGNYTITILYIYDINRYIYIFVYYSEFHLKTVVTVGAIFMFKIKY